MLKTVKFGGSSVAGADQFRKVKAIVESDPSRRIVVVSAAGKRFPDDHKLTDLLYLCHAHLQYGVSCDEIFADIRSRFLSIRDELGLSSDIGMELDALRSRLNKDFSVDELVSRGEYFTSRLMAEYLGYVFVDAADCVFFNFEGQIDREQTDAALKEALEKYGRIVIPGFYGRLPSGKIKVMSRGGSDISGALAAAATESDIYENWTDVSGILMADPRIVENPRSIAHITYSELRELAFMGASVLHEESILPVREKGIPLNIRNTNCPDHPGTMIVDKVEDEAEQARFLTGVTGRRGFQVLTVHRHDMNLSRTLSRALAIFDRYHINVEHITLGLDSFALVASASSLGENLYEILSDMKKECHAEDIEVRDNIALVAAVGRKMSARLGTSGEIFNALGMNGVNIRTIAQGSDELSIIIGVDNSDYETAVRVLYEGFAG
ncbi:MAG: aspartate kinase [Oscillospiraceae bacterium]|nr:aspartate kinase [Oscillospiraceae bacterium]